MGPTVLGVRRQAWFNIEATWIGTQKRALCTYPSRHELDTPSCCTAPQLHGRLALSIISGAPGMLQGKSLAPRGSQVTSEHALAKMSMYEPVQDRLAKLDGQDILRYHG